MQTLDVSTIAPELWPLDLLRRLREAIGEFMLIGSLARDIVTHGAAGLPLGRATNDLDIAVTVPSVAAYRELLTPLGPSTGTAYRYHLGDSAVDVLPFGALAHGGAVEVNEDQIDVSGLAEAYAKPVMVTLDHRLIVRCPTLSAQIALKLVAWRARRGYTSKDAEDLGALITATYSGVFEDDCWGDERSLEHCHYDLFRVGPYRAGLSIGSTFGESTRQRLQECLGPSLRGRLELDLRNLLDVSNRLDALWEGIRHGSVT